MDAPGILVLEPFGPRVEFGGIVVKAENADGVLIAGDDYLEVIDVLLEGGDDGVVGVGEGVVTLAADMDCGEDIGATGGIGIAAAIDVIVIFGADGMAVAYAPVVYFYFALDIPIRLTELSDSPLGPR